MLSKDNETQDTANNQILMNHIFEIVISYSEHKQSYFIPLLAEEQQKMGGKEEEYGLCPFLFSGNLIAKL